MMLEIFAGTALNSFVSLMDDLKALHEWYVKRDGASVEEVLF